MPKQLSPALSNFWLKKSICHGPNSLTPCSKGPCSSTAGHEVQAHFQVRAMGFESKLWLVNSVLASCSNFSLTSRYAYLAVLKHYLRQTKVCLSVLKYGIRSMNMKLFCIEWNILPFRLNTPTSFWDTSNWNFMILMGLANIMPHNAYSKCVHSCLEVDGQKSSSQIEMSEWFNKFFLTLGCELAEKLHATNTDPLSFWCTHQHFDLLEMSSKITDEAINSLS